MSLKEEMILNGMSAIEAEENYNNFKLLHKQLTCKVIFCSREVAAGKVYCNKHLHGS